MLIERQSPYNQVINRLEIDITEEQLQEWKDGTLIQDAMPNITAGEREFILTGMTSEDWLAIFGPEEQE